MNNSTINDKLTELKSSLHLGHQSKYVSTYTPSLLQKVPRSLNRDTLDIKKMFLGYDLWHLYEVSYLNPKGKPCVAIGEIIVPASSPYIFESKSLKLYLNSFNQSKFLDLSTVENIIAEDLSKLVEAEVNVKLFNLNNAASSFFIENDKNEDLLKEAFCLDDIDVEINEYNLNPNLLVNSNNNQPIISETVYSNLLKSNCLITSQPDWGTVVISYTGNAINHQNLLKYIISMRQHNEFHEHCVERIFTDICNYCHNIKYLEVRAFYTRRGGVDINPVRSTSNPQLKSYRLLRQ
ncbi:MAG: NADPH-dependent 7-cyano-7-deazaguanine reductase QueF [Succinivibrionaceae bacterium]